MRGKPHGALLVASVLGGILAAGLASAQQLGAVLSAEEDRIRQAQRAQAEINQIAERTRARFDEHQILLKEIDGIVAYNDVMQAYIDGQERQLADLRASIDNVTLVERQILPLIGRMIDGLERFVSLDIPFRLKERMGRVQSLRQLLQRADVTTAEQFRIVMQAWQTEIDYGLYPETYTGELMIGGTNREVDFLMVGRTGFYYVTPDDSLAGAWDQRTRQWVELTRADAANIRAGIKVLDTSVPRLFMVPIAPPQEN